MRISSNYIYQTIHTIAHHPLYVQEHCRVLERAFLEVYFRPLILDGERITEQILEVLQSKPLPTEVSVFVELRVDIDLNMEVVISEISIYEGYSLRCISPSAECVRFDSPFGHYPTSARREVLRFADEIARNFGGEVAIECDAKGRVISGGGGALFGVAGRDLVSIIGVDSVERGLVMQAAQRCFLNVSERVVAKRELIHFDELFIVDHYGVTSISRCAERHYVPAVAETIADQLTQPWQ